MSDIQINPERHPADPAYDSVVVQRWMALDLWMVLGFDSRAFEAEIERVGWATLWSELLAHVRFHAGMMPS